MTVIHRDIFKTDILSQLVFQSGVQAEKDAATRVHFHDGYAYTFDDERINMKPCPIDYSGTAPIKLLIASLGGTEEEINVTWKGDKKTELKLIVKNGNSRSVFKGTPANVDILAQHDVSTLKWHKVDQDLLEYQELLEATVSKNVTNFQLSSIHCTPDYFQAASEAQICRVMHSLPKDFEFLIRYGVIKNIFKGATSVARTKEYMYFQYGEGLVTGIRIFEEKYLASIPKQIEKERTGICIELPSELSEAIKTAELFTDENQSVVCSMGEGVFAIKTQNAMGSYIAKAKVDYMGETKSFMLKAKVLASVLEMGHKCLVTEEAIRIEDPGTLIFLTSIISQD